MFRNVSLLASALLLSPMVAYGAAVTLAWDANTEDDLAGYKIHYGTTSHSYSQSIDVGDVTEYTLEDLDDGVTYYLAATAYDDAANESGYSAELVHTFTTVGHYDYCRDAGPCAAGEGDCDNDSECEAGLTCVQVTGVDTCQTISPDPNNSPTTPSVPVGSSTGHIQTSYNFSTTASDPKRAYDYGGVFGWKNAPWQPETREEIGSRYSCATLVVAALHYSGYELNSVHRGGRLDVVTPKQVVMSRGMARGSGK